MKQATGAKGKALFQPLRLALTGREHGPELKQLLPLIGRARAMARLDGKSCLQGATAAGGEAGLPAFLMTLEPGGIGL